MVKQREYRHRSPLAFLVALGLSVFLSLSSLAPSQAIHWSEVPDPRQDNNWVMDTGDILSFESEAKLNQMISALEAKNGIEMVVVTVPEVAPLGDTYEFALTLFNTWKIGKRGQNNGVVFLASKQEGRAAVEKGSGLRSDLTYEQVNNIIQTQITPQFEQGNFDTGIVNGVQAMIQILENKSEDSISFFQIVLLILGAVIWAYIAKTLWKVLR
ncbi:YgcG family protein [Acaryochloris sp. IP29b_bin.148]|uniref:TPM domain-containing protein n=1 Tax=Acaryochloris sp. IP29b_bin.148 TaxID=2969218 RepID=UPI00261C98A9|nr:TPM domain-containing protein [Acaryochloris sp. IP29b_bin.148]